MSLVDIMYRRARRTDRLPDRRKCSMMKALRDLTQPSACDHFPGEHAVFSALGVSEIGGAIRVGLAHYTNATEVERLINAVAALR